nr:hypothetical protein DGKKSRWO_DGKKSRWO_CDS_0102 [uncultured phage]CAI9752279.1 hypothetical protein CVNMHQAP_CVNMHQAP_CDS_0102 [uncultured phage]
MSKPLSPTELLDRIRAKAKLDEKGFDKQVAIKLNKPGKIKLQLLALDSDHLFKARTQHFIPTLPDNEDPNEKIMVVDCQGEHCPICDAATAFKNSGITVDAVNEAYHPKYPYPKLRNVFTQPEHFLLAVRVLADQADDGTYLPKNEAIGSTQLLQLSKSALSSLMSSYEDFLSDYDGDAEELPPLFGVFEGTDKVKSFTVNLRVQVQGAWSYIFSFGKAIETSTSDVNMDKLKFLSDTVAPTEDYVEKAVKRIHDIQNYFVGAPVVSAPPANTINSTAYSPVETGYTTAYNKTAADTINSIVDDDDDFNIDTL